MNKKKRLNLYLFLSILVAFMVGVTSPVFAVDWRHVGVPGDTYGKRIDLQGDTPALLFSDGQDTYAFWQKTTGKLLLEYLGDTDVLEVDTRGRVTVFKTPIADSDAATKKYVDNNVGGGGDGGMSAWGDGSDTVIDPDTGVAGDNIDLVPSATPGKFRLNASGGGSSDTAGLRFSDGGTFQGIYPEANFGTDLSVSCSGDTCTVNSTASGGGGGGDGVGYPRHGDIWVDGSDSYTNLPRAMSNADSTVFLGPGSWSAPITIDTGGFRLVGSGNKSVLSGSNDPQININANGVWVSNLAMSNNGFEDETVRISGGDDIRFTNVNFNSSDGEHVHIQSGNNILFQGNRFSFTDGGVKFRNSGGNVRVVGNYFASFGNQPAIRQQSGGGRYVGNTILGTETGFDMDGGNWEIVGNRVSAGGFGSPCLEGNSPGIYIGNRCHAGNNSADKFVAINDSNILVAFNRFTGNDITHFTGSQVNNARIFGNVFPSAEDSRIQNNLQMNSNSISELPDPTNAQDAVSKNYHDSSAQVVGLEERSDTPTLTGSGSRRWLCEDSAGALACDTGDVVESINNGTSTKHVIDIDFSAN